MSASGLLGINNGQSVSGPIAEIISGITHAAKR